MKDTQTRIIFVILMILLTACAQAPNKPAKPPSEMVKLTIPQNNRISLSGLDGKNVRGNTSGVIYLEPGSHELFITYMHEAGFVMLEKGSYTWNGYNYLSISGKAGEAYRIVPGPDGKLTIQKR